VADQLLVHHAGRPDRRYDDGVTVNQNGNPAIFSSTTDAANWKADASG
jgi:hypothetical protein